LADEDWQTWAMKIEGNAGYYAAERGLTPFLDAWHLPRCRASAIQSAAERCRFKASSRRRISSSGIAAL
jgi:hypothetical protein